MNFKTWLETKFHNSLSMTCGHCDNYLIGIDIEPNHKHIYTYGLMYKCSCGKSKVWTNSIRGTDELFSCFADSSQKYRRGFCNDAFCGHCFGYLQPLENGFVYKGKRTDRYGCEKCSQNQMVVVNGYMKDPEGEESTRKLYNRYLGMQDDLRKVIDRDRS